MKITKRQKEHAKRFFEKVIAVIGFIVAFADLSSAEMLGQSSNSLVWLIGIAMMLPMVIRGIKEGDI